MEGIRANLTDLSEALPPQTPLTSHVSYITVVAPNVLAILSPSINPSIYLISLMPSSRPSTASRVKNFPLPPNFSSATKILPAQGMFAIIAPQGICICEAPSFHNLTLSPPLVLAENLFQSHPHLTVCDAAWSPAAPGFLLVLTSDANLRLYDVVSKRSAATERMCLHVVTSSTPVSFAFSRGSQWSALSVYLLTADGSIYLASPIAPVGTRLPLQSWNAMRAEANAVITREKSEKSSLPEQPNLIPTTTTTPRRTLDFSVAEEEPHSLVHSWAVRQARLQQMFLETVFKQTSSGDMVAIREFKPAPLLFQGPLYTEKDDLQETEEASISFSSKFCDLTLLHCGMDRPPVLLRSSNSGEVSVLIGLEKVDAQWFLSSEDQAAMLGGPLEANNEYAESARAVAPLLLCFEHLSFGDHVAFFPLGQMTDADVLYAFTSTSVFSVHLSFISAITDAGTLESMPKSSISEVLTIWNPQREQEATPEPNVILGLAPWYAKGLGPISIMLSSDGNLHASNPLRWMTEFAKSWPPALLGSELCSDRVWTTERPQTGSRAFACPESGKEVLAILRAITDLQRESGGRVAMGTLGNVKDITSFSAVVNYLEARIEVIIGGPSSAGIADNLKSLADVLDQWSADLRVRAGRDADGVEGLRDVLLSLERSQNTLHKKLTDVEKGSLELKQRLGNIMNTIQSNNSVLSTTEAQRYKRLKEKRRHLRSLRERIEDLSRNVQYAPSKTPKTSPMRSSWTASNAKSPRSSFARSRVMSPSSSWNSKGSPFAQRKTERSPHSERIDLSRQEMKEIRSTLMKHSEDIGVATELTSKLWKQLATT